MHEDEQGSIGWITGPEGSLENGYEYEAFGGVRRREERVANRVLYGSRQYDEETGQC